MAAAFILLGAGPLTGHAANGQAPADRKAHSGHRSHTVIIEGMRFEPGVVTVAPGDRVTWINEDPFPHTVTSSSGKFDSHPIAPGASWSYIARRPGKYDYICTLHVTMKGRLDVR